MTNKLELGTRIISWRKPEHFNNCDHLNNQIRLIICGSSGSGKTSVLYNLLLDSCPIHNKGFLDYDCLVLVSQSLNQYVYKIIISGYKAGLSREHIRIIFDLQEKVSDVDKAKKTIQHSLKLAKIKVEPTEIITFKLPSDLPPVEELNPDRKKKALIIFDYSMMLDLSPVKDYFCRARNKIINLIFITQGLTKLKRSTIRTNCNQYMIFRQPDTILRDAIYEEIASSDFNTFEEYKKFCHNIWKNESGFDKFGSRSQKHNFILINLDNRKYYSTDFIEVVLPVPDFHEPVLFKINTGMSLQDPGYKKYLEAASKASKAKKIISY